MKVLAPGSLVIVGYSVAMHGWAIDTEGRQFTSQRELHKASLRAALLYVLSHISDDEAENVTPAITFDSEREALDVIAQARWRPTGTVE